MTDISKDIPFQSKKKLGDLTSISNVVSSHTTKLAETATKVELGDLTTFKATGTNVTDKTKNEFSDRGINLEWYSSLVAGTDWTPALRQAAADAIARSVPLYSSRKSTINLYDTVNLVGVRNLELNGIVNSYVDNKPCLIIGGDSRNGIPVKVYINQVTKKNTLNAGDIAIRVVGLKNGEIKIDQSYYTQLYANAADVSQSSISYSSFYLGKNDILEMYGEAGISWITECNFYGGRFNEIRIGNAASGYQHNNNTFYKPCVEAGKINIIKGIRNIFRDIRSEGGTQVVFEADSARNVIIDNYSPNWGTIGGAFTITDNGRENIVVNNLQQQLTNVSLLNLTPDTKLFNDTCEYELADVTGVTGGLDCLKLTQWKYLLKKVIPTSFTKRVGFTSDIVGGAALRAYVYCYDANMALMSEGSTPLITGYGLTYNSTDKSYYFSTNITNTEVFVFDNNVKFIEFQLRVGDNVTALKVKSINVYAEILRNNVKNVENIQKQFKNELFSTGVTSGVAKKGQMIATTDGILACVKRIDFTTTTQSNTATNKLFLTDATGIEVNDIVGVNLDTGFTFWSKVSAVDTTTKEVTLTANVTSNVLLGAKGIINKWIKIT